MPLRLLQRAALTLTGVFLLSLSGSAHAYWGLRLSQSAGHSEADTTWSSAIDQQYYLNMAAHAFGQASYTVNARFRHLQADAKGQPTRIQKEWQPTATLNWRSQNLDSRTEYALRSIQDPSGANNLEGRSISTTAQTHGTDWPQLTGRYSWAKNVNDLELQGFDTRQRAASLAALLTRNRYTLGYQISDLQTINERTNVRRDNQTQDGRADFSLGNNSSVLSTQFSYRVTDRTDLEHNQATGATLSPLPVASGLYLPDPTPDFGSLQTEPGLVDGNTQIAASPELNLASGAVHNFGLDFAATVSVSHLHLYTDTLVTESLTWSVWTSTDNLNWVELSTFGASQFSVTFNRFEIDFSPIDCRYIKLVQVAWLAPNPVYVTELRGLASLSPLTEATLHSIDHRASAGVNVRPAHWLDTRLAGDVQDVSSSQTKVGRQQAGASADIRTVLAAPAEFLTQYRFSQTRFEQERQPETVLHQAGISLISHWAEPLSHRISYQRRQEYQNRPLTRRTDEGRVLIEAALLPRLRVSSEYLLTEDHRPEIHDVFHTRTLHLASMSSPLKTMDLQLDFRETRQTADVQAVPGFLRTYSGRSNVRLSPVLQLGLDYSRTAEPHTHFDAYDAVLSWTATRTLSFSNGYSATRSANSLTDEQWSLQGYWKPTTKWDITVAYSRSGTSAANRIASTRVGLNARL